MRKTKTHNVLRRLLAFVLIVSLLPLGYAGNVMAATTGTRNVSIQVTYGQTDARNVYGMINIADLDLSHLPGVLPINVLATGMPQLSAKRNNSWCAPLVMMPPPT